jgi:hypothetical protein
LVIAYSPSTNFAHYLQQESPGFSQQKEARGRLG